MNTNKQKLLKLNCHQNEYVNWTFSFTSESLAFSSGTKEICITVIIIINNKTTD
jgi:hypothetical protein